MSHSIPLQDAIDMTTLYRGNKENILATNYKNQNILALNETFDASEFKELLDQDGCVKVRVYYGMDSSYKVHAVFVGVDGKDQDMIPDSSNGFKIMEAGIRCPTTCPPSSDLNS